MTIDDKLKKVSELLAAGCLTVSPTVAAEILGCRPYTLNVTARQGVWDIQTQGYFSGRNLRIYVSWLADVIQKARCSLERSSGNEDNMHPHDNTSGLNRQEV